jgi:hypothetical protein
MKAFRIFFFTIIGLAVLLFLVATTAAPLRKMSELNKIATSDSVFMNKYKAIAKYPRLFPLVKEKAQKQAQVTLAEEDSIGLVINLKENRASLMLKGVEIHSSSIINFKKDRVFDGIKSPAYRKLFTYPIHNISEYSSVIKEPIVYKKAPKDTIEYMKMFKLPAAPPPVPAYVNFKMEYGFRLILVQNEWVTDADKELELKYKSDLHHLYINNNFKAALNLKEATYIPSIIVIMDRNEVQTIYRAIPKKADIVLIM